MELYIHIIIYTYPTMLKKKRIGVILSVYFMDHHIESGRAGISFAHQSHL